jgi:hypothetical protein
MNRVIKFRAWELNPRYEIGTDGQVYSTDFNHSGERKALKQYDDKDGYKHVFLYDLDKKRHIRNVHRLVASHFLTKPSPKHQVNHRNGVRIDNRLENLEYLTSGENTLHGWRVNGRKVTDRMREVARAKMQTINRTKWPQYEAA